MAIPTLCIGEAELRVGGAKDPRIDQVSMAAMALGAANLLGRVSEEALVRSGEGGLWVRRGPKGLYVAARPSYVFRGEFHIDEEGSLG